MNIPRTLRLSFLVPCALLSLLGLAPFGCSDDESSPGTSHHASAGASSSASSSSSSSASSSSSGGGNGDFAERVGLACTNDSDCGPELVCLKETDDDPVRHGGAAGGYCTKSCLDDPECGGSNRCSSNERGGLCMYGCKMNTPPFVTTDTPLDPMKCHGRKNLGCFDPGDGGFCYPMCGTDADCPGMKCDPSELACVDVVKEQIPTGEPCTGPLPCSGICVTWTNSLGVEDHICHQGCVLGGEQIGTSDCGGIDKGVCLLEWNGTGAGDYGLCLKTCQTQDDCHHPLFWCEEQYYGAICFPEHSCPAGQQDCADVPWLTCTFTKYGNYCIDPKFPLGDAAL